MVLGRSINLAHALNGSLEIKMNQELFLRVFGVDSYLDGKSVLRWGKLGREACL